MLIDAKSIIENSSGQNAQPKKKAIDAFVKFIENKLGALVIQDPRQTSYPTELQEPMAIAALLIDSEVLVSAPTAIEQVCDEPHIKIWRAETNTQLKHVTGGISHTSDAHAAYAAIAEGLERFLWAEMTDYFIQPTRASEASIAKKGPHTALNRFAGFSTAQREQNQRLTLPESAEFLWVQGHSLISGKKTFVPAQAVSSKADLAYYDGKREPLVRLSITTGLATWTSIQGARLRGALEAVERDAYMIWWLNQLVVPKIPVAKICTESKTLQDLIDTCARYRLKTHILRLPSDAPAYSMCVVLEDETSVGPRFTFGLKTSRSISDAIEAGILEGLRARHTYRLYRASGKKWDPTTPIETIGHRDRLYYWSVPENAIKLERLLDGIELSDWREPWENDSEEEHLDRIVKWCKDLNYEFVAVTLGTSKSNATPWSVEMVLIPELQPTYLHESLRQAAGPRLSEIPIKLGYTPRLAPFTDAPHPFL